MDKPFPEIVMWLSVNLLRTSAILVAVVLLPAACNPQTDSSAAGSEPDKAQTACWLLPAAAVSKVLGQPLIAVADLGAIEYGNTSCNYYAADKDPDEDPPRLTLTLDWNGYNIVAIGIPKRGPPTAANPYADIGDGATLKHGILWVRAGRHSLALELRGAGNVHAIAQQLLAAAKPKLQP